MENNELILKEENALLEILHSKDGLELKLDDIPQPFENDIFLYGATVAGTNHVEEIEEIAADLDLGEKVYLFREPENPYDERAILIKDEEGRKIGYIARKDNIILSRLMDSGKILYGTVRINEKLDDFRHIVVKVYMKD